MLRIPDTHHHWGPSEAVTEDIRQTVTALFHQHQINVLDDTVDDTVILITEERVIV